MQNDSTDAKSRSESQVSSTTRKLKKKEIKKRDITTYRRNVDYHLCSKTKQRYLLCKKKNNKADNIKKYYQQISVNLKSIYFAPNI